MSETRLDTLRRRAEDVRVDILLDAAEIAERGRHCFELAELDRHAADSQISPWVRVGDIVDGVLQDLLSGREGIGCSPGKN